MLISKRCERVACCLGLDASQNIKYVRVVSPQGDGSVNSTYHRGQTESFTSLVEPLPFCPACTILLLSTVVSLRLQGGRVLLPTYLDYSAFCTGDVHIRLEENSYTQSKGNAFIEPTDITRTEHSSYPSPNLRPELVLPVSESATLARNILLTEYAIAGRS